MAQDKLLNTTVWQADDPWGKPTIRFLPSGIHPYTSLII